MPLKKFKKFNKKQKNLALKKVETKIVHLTGGAWSKVGSLLIDVQQEELYKGEYPSFRQWLLHFARRRGLAYNTLTQNKSATVNLKEFADNFNKDKPKDKKVSLDQLAEKIPFRSMQEISRIAGKDEELRNRYIGEAFNHHSSSHELQKVANRLANERKRAKHNRDDNHVQNQDNVTAPMIVEAFEESPSWLEEVRRLNLGDRYRPHKPSFYRVFSEFPVITGATKRAQRMDELVIETCLDESPQESHVNVHGIENKVTKDDLLSDNKWQFYAEFTDFFWFAVPPFLVEDAKQKISQQLLPAGGAGVLSVDENKNVKVVKAAKKNLAAGNLKSLAAMTNRVAVLTEAITHSPAQINRFLASKLSFITHGQLQVEPSFEQVESLYWLRNKKPKREADIKKQEVNLEKLCEQYGNLQIYLLIARSRPFPKQNKKRKILKAK